jgi:hypothetical protein
MKFPALAIRAGAIYKSVPAGFFATARAVIIAYAELKLIPALLAKAFVCLTNVFTAVDTDRRPKKVIQTLQDK